MDRSPLIWEDATLWRKIHNLWISELYQRLKPQVSGRLSLSIDQEVTLVELEPAPVRVRPDLHLSEEKPPGGDGSGAKKSTGAVAYAEGIEEYASESRHYIVLRDPSGKPVVAILEILSPTNKGYYSHTDLQVFQERRQRLFAGQISYLEVDAVPVGKRWLPRCLEDLSSFGGVAWSSLPGATGRHFKGWAWSTGGPLPVFSWDLDPYGSVEIDLDATVRDALRAAGYAVDE